MVKPGYKQTEIGVIPEDWEVLYFRDCFEILPNNTLPRTELNNDEGTAKNIHYGDILVKYESLLNCSKASIPYITNPSLHITSKPLVDGDIVIADTAEDETVGKAVEITDAGNQLVVPGLHTIPCRATDSNMFATGWLGFFLNSSVYHDQLLPLITGTKVSAISKMSISDTVILVPPFSEQKRIAEALSDVDELIASLEKLIAKKKAIKQGAMQELLAGKRRLPGFSGEWTSKKLKDCTERIIVGLATSVTQYYREEGIPIFRNLNILPNRLDESDVLYLDPSFAKLYSNKQVKEDDVLTVHTGYVGTSCLVPKNHAGSLTFTTLITTVKKDLLSPQYLAFHLNSDSGAKMIEALQAGGGRNNLNVSDFEQYELTFPQDMDEQVAIANILEDLDKEIGCIEQKHKKSIEIKQGMVQQLLTGKIRLV